MTTIIDNDGDQWVSDGEGTFRCATAAGYEGKTRSYISENFGVRSDSDDEAPSTVFIVSSKDYGDNTSIIQVFAVEAAADDLAKVLIDADTQSSYTYSVVAKPVVR